MTLTRETAQLTGRRPGIRRKHVLYTQADERNQEQDKGNKWNVKVCWDDWTFGLASGLYINRLAVRSRRETYWLAGRAGRSWSWWAALEIHQDVEMDQLIAMQTGTGVGRVTSMQLMMFCRRMSNSKRFPVADAWNGSSSVAEDDGKWTRIERWTVTHFSALIRLH